MRWYGILLEVLSILTIAYELNKSLVAAERPPLFRSFIGWIGSWRFIFVQRLPITGVMNTTLGVSTVEATGYSSINENRSVEDKVAFLLHTVESLQINQGNMSLEINRNRREFLALLTKEAAERERSLAALKGSFEEQSLGDVRIQVTALFVLMLSILFANAPDESAAFFRAIGLGSGRFW